jgi:hypothetical protein
VPVPPGPVPPPPSPDFISQFLQASDNAAFIVNDAASYNELKNALDQGVKTVVVKIPSFDSRSDQQALLAMARTIAQLQKNSDVTIAVLDSQALGQDQAAGTAFVQYDETNPLWTPGSPTAVGFGIDAVSGPDALPAAVALANTIGKHFFYNTKTGLFPALAAAKAADAPFNRPTLWIELDSDTSSVSEEDLYGKAYFFFNDFVPQNAFNIAIIKKPLRDPSSSMMANWYFTTGRGDEVNPIVRGQVGTGLANWDMILKEVIGSQLIQAKLI